MTTSSILEEPVTVHETMCLNSCEVLKISHVRLAALYLRLVKFEDSIEIRKQGKKSALHSVTLKRVVQLRRKAELYCSLVSFLMNQKIPFDACTLNLPKIGMDHWRSLELNSTNLLRRLRILKGNQ